jgi:DNA-directed RNA polymerase specialized sigma24 family protein
VKRHISASAITFVKGRLCSVRTIRQAAVWMRDDATRVDRRITAAGLTALLASLDADADRAAAEYERLRHALIKFFDWRAAWPPEECADEVLDRMTRRLQDTAVHDVRRYAHGIARLVLLERRRQPVFVPIEDDTDLPETRRAHADEGIRDCFDRCLEDLPSDSRSLLLRYYEGEGADKIANRRQLGITLGLSDTALRSRVQRLRDRLERCVQSCVSKHP